MFIIMIDICSILAAKERQLRRGVKEVTKFIRKGEDGLCVLAADISPIDVITHIPVLCEDAGIPYAYVSSKELLGWIFFFFLMFRCCFFDEKTNLSCIGKGS